MINYYVKKPQNITKKKEGKCYTISKIDINYNLIQIDDWYSLDPNHNWYLWKYFCTLQEMRKMKLKQLKQC